MKRFGMLGIVVAVSGCSSVADVRNQIAQQAPRAKTNFELGAKKAEPVPRVLELAADLTPVTRTSLQSKKGVWLKSIPVSFGTSSAPLPISRILGMIASKGVNILSDLPLDAYQFAGTVNSTDADTALRLVLGSAGLDFEVDDERRVVTVKPMTSRTWMLAVGNRRTSFTSGGSVNAPTSSSSAQGQGSQQESQGGQNNGASGGGQSQGQGSMASASPAGGSGGAQPGATGIASDDDFWAEFEEELGKRLKVAMPSSQRGNIPQSQSGVFPTQIPGMSGMPQLPSQGSPRAPETRTSASEVMTVKSIGTFSVNRVTGAVYVQAPRWFLDDLDPYIRTVQQMYNAVVVFRGELILVTGRTQKREAVDVQGFANLASRRWGALFSNNSLGGITVNFPDGRLPNLSANGQAIPGPLLGVRSAADGLSLFYDYMDSLGNYSVKERVNLSTSAGIPSSVNTLAPRYYQEIDQQAVAGNVGAAQQATRYLTRSKDFGTEMRVNPKFDFATGHIRAEVDIRNIIYAGDQVFSNPVSIGNSQQILTSKVPLERKLNYSGHIRIRPGDLMILGGQDVQIMQSDETGLPGGAAPLGGVFGNKQSSVSTGTYYFVLSADVERN